jgi:hypothetical protein
MRSVVLVAVTSFVSQAALARGSQTAPRSVDELIASARTLSAEEMASIARRFEAPEYLVIGGHIGGFTLVGGKGDLMRIGEGFGQTVEPDQTVKVGMFWNHAPDPIFIRVGNDEELTAVPSGAFIVVGDLISDNQVFAARPRTPGEAVAASVSVTCGSEFYACCTGTGGSSYKARCRRNGISDSDCAAGGTGASSCTIGD